jgi:6-pyruvoyltetrahydropterin/6-carboxytetrahydropterin synthase
MTKFTSTKVIELGSCAFRQPNAESHCRFLHGYQLKAKFWFTADELDSNNWVVDFGSLKELKKFLQDQFDHTTCISKDDPKLSEFERLNLAGVCDLRVMDGVGIEKFAEWCHDAADNFVGVMTKMRCRCVAVEVFEHDNNSAIYTSTPENNKKKSTKAQTWTNTGNVLGI